LCKTCTTTQMFARAYYKLFVSDKSRLDGKGFRGIFDELICGVTVSELIASGSLSQYQYFATETSMSIEGVGKRQGDFKVVGKSIELTPELSLWIDKCDRLLFERELYARKSGWCAYRLLESKTNHCWKLDHCALNKLRIIH